MVMDIGAVDRRGRADGGGPLAEAASHLRRAGPGARRLVPSTMSHSTACRRGSRSPTSSTGFPARVRTCCRRGRSRAHQSALSGGGQARPSPDPPRAAAHVLPAGGSEAWLSACVDSAETEGRLVLIHRADRLADCLAASRAGSGPSKSASCTRGAISRRSAFLLARPQGQPRARSRSRRRVILNGADGDASRRKPRPCTGARRVLDMKTGAPRAPASSARKIVSAQMRTGCCDPAQPFQ